MKHSLKATVVLVSTLGVSAALAYDKGDRKGDRREKAGEEDESQECYKPTAYVMQTYDVNRDGKLDYQERKRLYQTHREEMLSKFDKDKDGRLNDEEKRAFEREKKHERFARVDANGDGKIKRHEAEQACGPLKRFFGHVDGDGDGEITREEFANAKPPGRQARE